MKIFAQILFSLTGWTRVSTCRDLPGQQKKHVLCTTSKMPDNTTRGDTFHFINVYNTLVCVMA